ncbi:MAG: hypothetical protein AAFU60_08300, partial [Bacteroidota bacterium]
MTPCYGPGLRPWLYCAFLLLAFGSANTQTTILVEDFETDGNGIRYQVSNEFYWKEDAYFGRVYGPLGRYGSEESSDQIKVIGEGSSKIQVGEYTNYNGLYYVAGEDQDSAPGDGLHEKRISFELDISEASGLSFRGLFAAGNIHDCGSNRYDPDDYIRVQYSVDGGPMQQGMCFNAQTGCDGGMNAPMVSDPNCDGNNTTGTVLNNAFAEYSFAIPDGNYLILEIITHIEDKNEELAFDYV